MTRVYRTKKSRVVRRCAVGGEEIPVGSAVSYATPGFRGRTIYACAAHPLRRSDLTANGPLSAYYAAVEGLQSALDDWGGEDADELRDALTEAGSGAQEALDEWEAALENMGEGLSQGDTGLLIQERLDGAQAFIDACDSAYNQIEDFNRDDEDPPGERAEDDTRTDEEIRDEWVAMLRSEWEYEMWGIIADALGADQL